MIINTPPNYERNNCNFKKCENNVLYEDRNKGSYDHSRESALDEIKEYIQDKYN